MDHNNWILRSLLLIQIGYIGAQSDCGDPTPVFGVVNSPDFYYGSVVSISCENGYIITGSEVITCQNDGNWTDTPTCVPIECGDPIPAFGFVNSSDFYYGSVVVMSCENGYNINGSEVITCQDNGNWTDSPTCVPIDCGDPTPSNGLAAVEYGTTYGESATISCDSGYDLVGISDISCLATGIWSASPLCYIQDCSDPSPANGQAFAPSGTTYGDGATISCDPGYTLVGSSIITCLEGPGWSDYPICDIQDCGDPSPANGQAYVPSGTTYGESALIACDPGYTLIGSSSISCLDGPVWSDSTTCDIPDCGDPTPSNGQASLASGTTYGENATISCDPGYILTGSSNISCLDTGSWSDSPTCYIEDSENREAMAASETTFLFLFLICFFLVLCLRCNAK